MAGKNKVSKEWNARLVERMGSTRAAGALSRADLNTGKLSNIGGESANMITKGFKKHPLVTGVVTGALVTGAMMIAFWGGPDASNVADDTSKKSNPAVASQPSGKSAKVRTPIVEQETTRSEDSQAYLQARANVTVIINDWAIQNPHLRGSYWEEFAVGMVSKGMNRGGELEKLVRSVPASEREKLTRYVTGLIQTIQTQRTQASNDFEQERHPI